MNDASGEHVDEHARAVEAEAARGDDGPDANEVGGSLCAEVAAEKPLARVDPTRWWFASAAFPMLAGTLGPVASAFSICALVKPWRQHYPPGMDIRQAPFISDPQWLVAINAVQLGVALLANLFLLLNMARRVRFTVAMPVTIVGWYLSSLTLVGLAATAGGPLVVEPREEHIWSEAFYYGVFSALLYFVVATLLVVTAWGASTGHYDKDFQLATSQRTLMLQTIMFLVYLLVGALVFSTIEGWTYLDAVYWADVTLFTVGFGDMSAATTLGRALLFPYALVGVISLGLVIGSIRSLVLERGRRMLDARMVEKKRRKMLRRMMLRGEDDVLVPIREGGGGGGGSGGGVLRAPARTPTTELERREKEFRLMRHIQRKAAKVRRWVAMAMSSSTWVVLWLLGARIFQSCEADYQGWSYFDGVYFAFVSLITIGYGDMTPASNSGRAFFVFWSLLALPTMTVLISNAGDTVVKSIRDITNQVGSITILPGERGLTRDAKAFVRSLSCGAIFGDEDGDGVQEAPPGYFGQAQVRDVSQGDDADSSDAGDDELNDEADEERKAKSDEALADEESVLREGSGPQKSASGRDCSAASEPEEVSEKPKVSTATTRSKNNSGGDDGNRTWPSSPDFLRAQIPANRADYLVLLADEIMRVSQHLKHKPPRKYSFAEWAWFLRLMGEDERSADTHRKARPHFHHHHHGSGETGGTGAHHWGVLGFLPPLRHHHGNGHGHEVKDGDDGAGEAAFGGGELERKDSWSWVGSRSPLMGAQEEAEWVHEKLVMRLMAELRAARDEEKGNRRPGRSRSRNGKGRVSFD